MPDVARTIEAIWRMESAQIIASLTRMVRDFGLAEEVAQDAFLAALEQWPERGVPANPGAWLTTTAKHKAIDRIRREHALDEKYAQIARDLAETPDAEPAAAALRDDVLALVFTACHPVLPREARVALTLRVVAGLRTEEIARAFLVSSTTLGQRISRAKRTLVEAHVPFEVPGPDELPERVSAVLEVIYLVFNEGYSATSGDMWVRRDLADEAMRLGRVLAGLLPDGPEVHGLLALMELNASRFATRVDANGAPILLPDQDRSRWDRTLIRHGIAALDRAIELGRPLGAYTVQAAIAGCHARARSFDETDWEAIVSLYDALGQLAPSPVVALNRAVALLHADGPEIALAALDDVGEDPRMAGFHLFGAVRGDVLTKLGRYGDAARVLEAAAEVAPTKHERSLLLERAAAAADRTE